MEVEKLIKQAADTEEAKHGPKEIPQTEEEWSEFQEERRVVRELHDEIMTPTFRYACIVMLYAIAERELLRLVKTLEKEKGKQKLKRKDLKGSFLDRVTKFMDYFNVRLADCLRYDSLGDLRIIRNCIVHGRGELSLVKNKEDRSYLIGMKDRRPGFFAWEGMDLKIESSCIKQFVEEVWGFFIWVFDQLKWKIDDSWAAKEMG